MYTLYTEPIQTPPPATPHCKPHRAESPARSALDRRARAPLCRGDTQLGHEPLELQEGVEAVEHAHVCEAHLLDELELHLLADGPLKLDQPKEGPHDVEAAVALLPQHLHVLRPRASKQARASDAH